MSPVFICADAKTWRPCGSGALKVNPIVPVAFRMKPNEQPPRKNKPA